MFRGDALGLRARSTQERREGREAAEGGALFRHALRDADDRFSDTISELPTSGKFFVHSEMLS